MENDKRMLYSILDGMPMSVYLKDLTGKIIYFNKFAKKILGLSLSTQSYENEFSKANINKIKETDKQVLEEKCAIEVEELVKLKNNDSRWYNINKYPIYDNNDEISGICVIARDVEIERKSQEQRETYIATLTHDLQNPTLAQINALNLLLDENLGKLNEAQKNILNLTKDSCTYMLEMLLSLLDTYKFENGDYILDLAPCNLTKLIDDTCDKYKHLLKDKNITVEKNLKDVQDILSDDQFLRRILNNLCRFSINYSFKDTTIKLNLKKTKKTIKFQIRGEGYHIPPKTLNTLFDKYTTHFSKYNTVGVDICLYHSKQIVSALGGKVSISSKDNINTIDLMLPLNIK